MPNVTQPFGSLAGVLLTLGLPGLQPAEKASEGCQPVPTLTPAGVKRPQLGFAAWTAFIHEQLRTRGAQEPAICDHPAHPPPALGQGGPALTLTGPSTRTQADRDCSQLPLPLPPSCSWAGWEQGRLRDSRLPTALWPPSSFPLEAAQGPCHLEVLALHPIPGCTKIGEFPTHPHSPHLPDSRRGMPLPRELKRSGPVGDLLEPSAFPACGEPRATQRL